MEALLQPELWAALLTLTALEIVLGVDNIIFLSIVVSKLPAHQQKSARTLGLAGALVTRIGLLFTLSWLASLTEPWFTVMAFEVSGRDLVLLLGGLFLLWKATVEILEALATAGEEHAPPEAEGGPKRKVYGYWGAIIQIMILDIVFSLDSVITAVGMTSNRPVMVAAITIAIIVMMFFAGPLSRFVDRHPTVKVLALAFLVMVGAALVAEGGHIHVEKAYIYTAMAFSVGVELINLKLRGRIDAARERALARRYPSGPDSGPLP